jgi:hypothetical protein
MAELIACALRVHLSSILPNAEAKPLTPLLRVYGGPCLKFSQASGTASRLQS